MTTLPRRSPNACGAPFHVWMKANSDGVSPFLIWPVATPPHKATAPRAHVHASGFMGRQHTPPARVGVAQLPIVKVTPFEVTRFAGLASVNASDCVVSDTFSSVGLLGIGTLTEPVPAATGNEAEVTSALV